MSNRTPIALPAQVAWRPRSALAAGLRAAILLALTIGSAFPIGSLWADTPDAFAAALDENMPAFLATYDVPGTVVAYIADGEVMWTKGYGLADVGAGTPMHPDMIFNFGSCGKVLAAWGVMRLIDQGKLDLDAPVNRYLKRWQLQSAEFDPSEVTIRRLLSHTGGLTVHGFNDYSPRRSLPSLADMLNGGNQLDGPVTIAWEPGTRFEYSGGGFVLLQMVIEDVTGEPFAAFMQREVTDPLGTPSLRWAWTPELAASAPVPYAYQGVPLEHRQLASYAVGSEVGTVTDFAHFVAAAVSGPNGAPAGRGVLRPETIEQMLQVQPNTKGTAGLAYGIAAIGGDTMAMHFGSNAGWNAFFMLDVERREGLVAATNSIKGFPLLEAVQNLWTRTVLGAAVNVDAPVRDELLFSDKVALGIAGILGVALALAALRFVWRGRSGRWHWAAPRGARALLPVLPWALLAFFWWYWFFGALPLPFPPGFPDFWATPQTGYVMALLVAWVAFGAVQGCTREG